MGQVEQTLLRVEIEHKIKYIQLKSEVEFWLLNFSLDKMYTM